MAGGMDGLGKYLCENKAVLMKKFQNTKRIFRMDTEY